MSAEVTGKAGQSPHPAERREARRFSLMMMRTAKLLCESGEYIGILRDISATGTKIRLFHPLPPDTHLFLELANGARYAMERIWHRDVHAGFRFSSSIDVDEFMEEATPYSRRPIRLRIQKPATLRAKGQDCGAMLMDFSQHGACIEAGRELAVLERLRLDIPGLPPRIGNVRWRQGFTHGLVFQQAYSLDELARHAHTLQPFDALPEILPDVSVRAASRCA